jgi:DNA anti-recombination protein RmuC
MDWAQVFAIVLPVMLAVIVGVIYNNRRVDDLRSDINQRFADMNQRFVDMMQAMNNRFSEMNQTMNERLAQMNETINHRFSDMNQRISDLKSDVSEIRHLLIDLVRRDFDVQKVADR